MDLKPIAAEPSEIERSAIDAVVGAQGGAGERGLAFTEGPSSAAGARALRHLLLPALRAVQARVGWVSPGALGYICRRLSVPPAEGFGVASFYALLSLEERPLAMAHVCDDIACKIAGADRVCDELGRMLGPPRTWHRTHAQGSDITPAAGTPSTGEGPWLRSPCLGLCERAPAALVTVAGESPRELALGPIDATALARTLHGDYPTDPATVRLPQFGAEGLRLLARIGHGDPSRLGAYRAQGGYRALARAIELGPAGVVSEVVTAKLLGRGGAAFPTGRKWEAVARAPARPHYVVCNGDESEPGTFKDRILMEEDPFAVVEAMTLAGYATGSAKGTIYIRGEYPLAAERIGGAIAACRQQGFLGNDVMGRGFAFDIELARGAGAYICGEETALFNSIEGFRGEPRSKPPFPVEVGLFGKPTAVNNVETLLSVLPIISEGGGSWAAVGMGGSTGSKLFCVSGRVRRPGLYEVPFGTRLSALIALAGGVPEGGALRAVLMGGAAGGFLTPEELDVPLTFEDLRKAGATLGSGVVMVLDDTVPFFPILSRIAAFFRDESCGQCVPCRIGTVRQQELLERIERAKGNPSQATDARLLLAEVGQVMRDASICGLGQTASSAIESALKKLPVWAEGTA